MMDEPIVGSITFSNIANPNTWDIGERKALVFSCPSEAKRGEELFNAMQSAAYKDGFKAGMRRAVAIALDERLIGDGIPHEADAAYNMAIKHCVEAILAEADK